MPQEILNEARESIRKKILENINLTKTTDEMLEEQVRREVDRYFEGRYVPATHFYNCSSWSSNCT